MQRLWPLLQDERNEPASRQTKEKNGKSKFLAPSIGETLCNQKHKYIASELMRRPPHFGQELEYLEFEIRIVYPFGGGGIIYAFWPLGVRSVALP